MALDRRAGILLIAIEIIMIPLFAFQLYYGRDADPVALKAKSAHLSYYPMFQDIHVMLLVGFGFLMTFLRKYGFSSVSFNFLLCAVMMQWGLLMQSLFKGPGITIISLIETDILVAAVLISFGCILGKTSPIQMVLVAFLEVPVYFLNSHIGDKISVWKKYIKRFRKKKLKQVDSFCSKSDHVPKCVPVPEPETSCKKSSFEQLSLYSTDSLEENCFFFRKYDSNKSYHLKSASSESIITNSIISDISEDSLQTGSLSKDSLYKPMKGHMINTNNSTGSLKTIADFSNKALFSKCQSRDRSQTIGHSYQLEKKFKRRSQNFCIDEQSHNRNKRPSSYETKQLLHEAVSIDSLDNLFTANLYSLKSQFISEDSLNEEKKEDFNKFVSAHRKKSISDGLLHETRYFQNLFNNRDFVIYNKILLNEIKSLYNIEKINLKSNHDRLSLISLIELQYIEKYKSQDDKESIDSLSIHKSGFMKNISYGVPQSSLKINRPFSPNIPPYIHGVTENYESEDEKMSIDSLSIFSHSELFKNTHSKIKEGCLKRNKSFSPNTFWHKNSVAEYSERLNCSPRTKGDQNDSKRFETNQCYQHTMNNMIYNLNGHEFKKSNSTNNSSHKLVYCRDNGNEDSISVDSLCDSLN